MRIRYTFRRLSKEEKNLIEAVLLEEVEIQRWFAIACCARLGGEVFLSLH